MKTLLYKTAFFTLRAFLIVLLAAFIWDLIVNSLCTINCVGFASTRTYFQSLYFLLPLMFCLNLLIELGIQGFRKILQRD